MKSKETRWNITVLRGQKRGVKHGPPYPLNAATSAKIKKSATSTKNGKVGSDYEVNPADVSIAISTVAILAAPIVTAAIERHQYKKKWTSHRNDNGENLKKDRENEQIDPETGLYKKKKDKGIDDDLKKVNPCYEDGEPFQTNCTMCTAAMEMRRRGYDVAASALVDSRGGLREKQYSKWFKPPTEHKNYTNVKQGEYTKMKKDVAAQGDGARGEITVKWYMGGGHNMFYQVEKGKMVVYDGQSGKKYSDRKLTDHGPGRLWQGYEGTFQEVRVNLRCHYI